MAATKPLLPYTYDDYCTLPEDMSRRYELLHGDFSMVPAPTTKHQQISINLSSLLRQYVKIHRLGKILYSPVDVIFGQGDAREVVQPDLVFIAARNDDIEILSPGTKDRDRGYKLKMYARYGVPEYWIVDPETRTIDVYQSGGLRIPACHPLQ
ncbi:MAG: Uma2 family endonuclease [Gammaproteobacteria bacterium]|nr:Uma2 family endonuclease [Gammaproteobacteria bacterium]